MEDKRDFFLECYQLGIIKFGKFTLKSGIESPFYVDLRPLASDPKILKKLSKFLLKSTSENDFDLICGVPYAALPMATAMSLESDKPLIIKRKEAKKYGTKKLLEGIFNEGQSCLLVEDVITSGKSLLETIPEIEKEGISIKEIVVVLDREQGGKALLEGKGFIVKTLFTISDACEILFNEGKISAEDFKKIKEFIAGNPVNFDEPKRKTYEEKLAHAEHPAAKKLLEIVIGKNSNLIASADVTTTAKLLKLAEETGPHIAALKTHVDILEDFDYEKTILPLKEIAKKHDFLLMEDRKFGDIGSTQEMQYTKGIYKISEWADLVTSHVIAGEKSLDFFTNSGVISIVSMSSEGALTDETYAEKAEKISLSQRNVIGAVSQRKVDEKLLLFTPGINLNTDGDGKGQQYNTPDFVFRNLYTDFIIVGRGIYGAENAAESAKMYRDKGWQAYLDSIKND